MAFAVVRADETVTGAERIYLAQLAHALGLDPAAAARIEKEAAARIDAAGEAGNDGARSGTWPSAATRSGPVSAEEIIANLRNGTIDAATLCSSRAWRVDADPRRARVPGRTARRRPRPRSPRCRGRRAHEIGFTIHGEDLQFVEVELDPGESAVAEAGSMMFMTPGIEMETVFGDGSARTSRAASWARCSARASGWSPARASS